MNLWMPQNQRLGGIQKILETLLDKQMKYQYNIFCDYGAWLSLVEYLAWDQGVAGSNPAAPTRDCFLN